jgi:hypothetical protein
VVPREDRYFVNAGELPECVKAVVKRTALIRWSIIQAHIKRRRLG